MFNFANDVHHRTSTRLGQIIPDFIENEHPQFVAFLTAYYEFLEQADGEPITSNFVTQPGVVTVQSGNSTISGANTTFTTTLSVDQRMQVGSETFRVRQIANNTSVIVFELPVRTYFANTYATESNKTTRQASGALRQVLMSHDPRTALSDFVPYLRDTYLRDLPHGVVATETLIPRILDFYQSRGSEDSFRFLFRALYGQEIDIKYPRDSVFMASDGHYEIPVTIKLDTASITGNAMLLETRNIIGLTSNAQATIDRVINAYEGSQPVTTLFIEDLTLNIITGNLLTEADPETTEVDRLILTAFGKPPNGLSSVVYEYNLILEDSTGGEFLPGETVSTIPIDDPVAITGTVLGSVVGFTITHGGQNYTLGDAVFPPPGFLGGFGAVGRVSGYSNTDVTGITITDGGEGYYAGLSLIIDNGGTGGSGLAGYVQNVSAGHILLNYDAAAGINDNDVLVFTTPNEAGNVRSYQSSRETINYYEVGVALTDLFAALLLNSDVVADDGSKLAFDDAGTLTSLTQESTVLLNASSWSSNVGSALYSANLSSTISSILSRLSVFPIYVNGVRTAIGAVSGLHITSLGGNYIVRAPSAGVTPPVHPTADVAGLISLLPEYYTYTPAVLTVNLAVGQIGAIDVIAGGSAYEAANSTFMVNAATSIVSAGGTDAELGLVLSAITRGKGRFVDTRGWASSDRYLQSEDRYQPFAYELTVEEDVLRYGDVVKRMVHPAGGLMLVRQTVTSVVDVTTGIESSSVTVSP